LSDPRLDRVQTEVDEDRCVITVIRGPVRLFVNFGRADHCFALPADHDASILAVSDPRVRPGEASIVVPPDAVAIVDVGDA
jgi:hypothetical protein